MNISDFLGLMLETYGIKEIQIFDNDTCEVVLVTDVDTINIDYYYLEFSTFEIHIADNNEFILVFNVDEFEEFEEAEE